MGNATSQYLSTSYESWTNPSVVPSVEEKSTRDPLYGFQGERKERVAAVSEEDMYWAKIEPNKRDYCAQHLMDLQRCRKQNYPFLAQCEHYKHEWDHCQNEDTIYRMKEFERERRLRSREQRKKQQEAGEELHQA